MGAWGVDAFANDAALDAAADLLTTKEGVLRVLAELTAGGSDVAAGYAAAEIVATARAGERYWQSEGTTLFAGGAGEPYIPEEVAALLEAGVEFDDQACELALEALAIVDREVEPEGWRDPEERRAAIAATRARLLKKPPRPWAEVEPGARERLSPLAEPGSSPA